MKIADIYRYKESAYAAMANWDKEKQAELLKTMTAFQQKYAQNGKWKANYPFANGRGGIAIWEFESGEEMSRILTESPIWGYLDSEIIPLTETESVSNWLKELSKTAKQTSKK
jgi:muconolactone delta-isomerase